MNDSVPGAPKAEITEYSRVPINRAPKAEITEYSRVLKPRVTGGQTTQYSRVPGAPKADMTDTRWHWYSCDVCYIGQMLPVPGSKVRNYRKKRNRVLRVLGVFPASYCGLLRVLAVFRGSVLRIIADTQYFGVRYCGYSLYFKYLRVLTAGTARTGRISCAGTASTRSTLDMRSVHGV